MQLNYTNSDEHLIIKFQDKSGFELGIYPVLYGYRVKGGYRRGGYYGIEYCCGTDIYLLYKLLLFIKQILETYENITTEEICNIFPKNKIKPIFNDPMCLNLLKELGASRGVLWEVDNAVSP